MMAEAERREEEGGAYDDPFVGSVRPDTGELHGRPNTSKGLESLGVSCLTCKRAHLTCACLRDQVPDEQGHATRDPKPNCIFVSTTVGDRVRISVLVAVAYVHALHRFDNARNCQSQPGGLYADSGDHCTMLRLDV